MINKVIQGDCLEVMKRLDENSVDSIVTDPPYELGFMGKSWDNTGIANNKEMWKECLRVLKPGGHLLAFSGTRTYHRMASAIEDAGFEVRDMIEWVYGSGFPKSLNISKAIEKMNGVEPLEKIPNKGQRFYGQEGSDYHLTPNRLVMPETQTEDGKKWEGWGTATKPAHEPIAFCSKPLTVELIFTKMGIDITNNLLNLCQKYNVNVKDAESSLNSIHLKLEKVGANTVAENARMCDWENIESAVIVALNFMSPKHTLKEKTEESKEVSAQMTARENGNNGSQEQIIQTGKVDNLREQMATLQNMLATGTIGLNTISLWKELLEGVLEKAKTSTISTALEMTTGLKICNSLLKANTQDYTRANEIRPNHEPICMARKPLAEKTVAENCLKWGTGGINIDESRVETSENITIHKGNKFGGIAGTTPETFKTDGQSLGRFPANLLHDNSEEVRECFPDTKTGKAIRSNSGGKTFGGENTKPVMEDLGYEDGGGNASRFFKSIIYQAKASKSERNKGCEELEKKENAGSYEFRTDGSLDGKPTEPKSNFHPTVKPIALMEYLIKMVTKPGGIVLEPFAGSGTTLVAAKQNGYQYIGIEKEKEYIDIINKRLEI